MLQDGTGQMNVYLFQKNAIDFFNGILPQCLLNPNGEQAKRILTYLQKICPNSFTSYLQAHIKDTYPVIDCCIQSYFGESKIFYQIFATVCR